VPHSWQRHCAYNARKKPVRCNGGEVKDEIVVYELFGMFSETLLVLKRSYRTAACDRLTEMNVDR